MKNPITSSDLLQVINNELESFRSFDFDITNRLMEKYEPQPRPDSSEARLYIYKHR